jgi:hypothetical protein
VITRSSKEVLNKSSILSNSTTIKQHCLHPPCGSSQALHTSTVTAWWRNNCITGKTYDPVIPLVIDLAAFHLRPVYLGHKRQPPNRTVHPTSLSTPAWGPPNRTECLDHWRRHSSVVRLSIRRVRIRTLLPVSTTYHKQCPECCHYITFLKNWKGVEPFLGQLPRTAQRRPPPFIPYRAKT